MTDDSKFKAIVRARMAVTGERYMVAMRVVLAAAQEAVPQPDVEELAGGRPCGTCGGDHWTRDHDDHVAVDRAYESADAPDRNRQ